MKSLLTFFTSCTFTLCSLSTAAQPPDFGDGLENLSPSRVLNNQEGRYDHWKGIGRIQSTYGQTCTATLIDTRTPDSAEDAPAYVLTSGHCAHLQNNGVIATDLATEGTVTFNYFADTVAHQQSYPLKRINWSSMQGVDLAIVELEASLNTLILAGIEPLRMAENMPDAGNDILIVGAPLSFESPYLRLAACTQQLSDEVIEQPWVWRHTVKNQCKNIETGSSGSPLLTRNSNEIFAVINASTLATRGRSATIAPTSETTTLNQTGNFGNPIGYLRSCFVEGVFSTDPDICPLFPTFSVEFSVTRRPPHHAKVKLDADGNEVYPGWNLPFSIDKPFYRYKTVRQALQCENPDHYSPAIEARDPLIDAPIGPQTGVHMLCILGVDSADERPAQGLMRNALTLALELQAPSPPSPPDMQISKQFNSYSVAWNGNERLISKHTYKAGPPDATDCNDPAGYKRVWRKINVPLRMLPLKICTYSHDHADQKSAVREDLLLPNNE